MTRELLRQKDDQIIKLKQENEKLREDLIHDYLTGLKTRKFLLERVHEILSEMISAEDRRPHHYEDLSFIFCDIDDFKKLNDNYGHDVGDQVLVAVARVLSENVRETDIFSRWGGEEMVAALPGSNLDKASDKAEELRQKIEKLRFAKHPEIKVTVSFGVSALCPSASDLPISKSIERLINQADEALLLAKEKGKNKVCRL